MILADTFIFYQFLDDTFFFFLIKWYQLTWSFSSFCKWCLSITYSTNFNEVATTALVVLLLIKKKKKIRMGKILAREENQSRLLWDVSAGRLDESECKNILCMALEDFDEILWLIQKYQTKTNTNYRWQLHMQVLYQNLSAKHAMWCIGKWNI